MAVVAVVVACGGDETTPTVPLTGTAVSPTATPAATGATPTRLGTPPATVVATPTSVPPTPTPPVQRGGTLNTTTLRTPVSYDPITGAGLVAFGGSYAAMYSRLL